MKQGWFNTISRVVSLAVILPASGMVNAQMTINNATYTVNQLVNGVLVPSGSGTTVSNISFRGVYNVSSRYQVGYFSTAGSTAAASGFSSGIVLSTGNTADIPLTLGTNPGSVAQMSRGYTSGTTGEVRSSNAPSGQDADVAVLIAPESYYNAAILEFDFVPVSNAVQFRYIFGSEEYNDQSGSAFAINYNCSSYNDQFAMLLSGPGIAGGQGYLNDAKNIARLPNNAEVGINSVNDGVVGSSGGSPNASNCLAANPAWLNGSPTTQFLGFIDGTELNGNTRILTAYQSGLTPGQTYHLKILIADSNDAAYDSIVYLEASSFTTTPSNLPVELTSYIGECIEEKGVHLNWEVESQRNNDYFLVERADEAFDFEVLDTIEGDGSTIEEKSYDFFDKEASPGTMYYRLTQVDFDGRSEQLGVVAVEAGCGILNPAEIQTAFNPATGELELFYTTRQTRTVVLQVTDAFGQIVQEETVELRPDKHIIHLPFSENNASGMYMVNVSDEQTVFTSKFIRQ